MSATLESIEYHRRAMLKSPSYSEDYHFHMWKAACFTKIWRQGNGLRVVV